MFYFNDFVGYIEGTTENEYLNQKDKKPLPSYKVDRLWRSDVLQDAFLLPKNSPMEGLKSSFS